MKKRKKSIVFVIIFLMVSSALISIPPFFVIGKVEDFTLKDTFEEEINNRIYSEYENATDYHEFFKNNQSDAINFEDNEGFTYEYGNFYSESVTMTGGTATIILANNIGNSYSYTVYTKLSNIDLMHYRHIQVKAKTNNTNYNNEIYFKDEDRDNIQSVSSPDNRIYVTDTTYKIYDINLDFMHDEETQISEFMLACRFSGLPSGQHNFIKMEIDYIKLFSNNETEYYTNLGDTADFKEDTDNINFGYATETYTSDNYLNCSPDGIHDYINEQITNTELRNFDVFEIKFYIDYNTETVIDNYMFIRLYDTDNDYIQYVLYDFPENTKNRIWVSETNYTSTSQGFEKEKFKEVRIMFKNNNGLLASNDFIYFDYFRFYREEYETRKKQETDFRRAKSGLKSFYHDYLDYYNSTIKIDCGTVDNFPTRLVLSYYTTIELNISMAIGETKILFYSQTLYLNEWETYRKNIERGNYLLNNTSDRVYFIFETYSNDSFKVWFDDLEISYTEKSPIYDYNVYDLNDTLDSWKENMKINASVNYLSLSGVWGKIAFPPYYYDNYTLGEKMSIPIFSRRVFYEKFYDVWSNYSEGWIISNDYFYIDVDKNYTFHVYFESSKFNISHRFSKLELRVTNNYDNTIYISKNSMYELIFTHHTSYKHTITVIQEDYNTFSLGSIVTNNYYSNYSMGHSLRIDINRDNKINNSLVLISHKHSLQCLVYIPYAVAFPIVPSSHALNFTYVSTKAFKHSPKETVSPDKDKIVFPPFNPAQPFLSLWEMIKAFFNWVSGWRKTVEIMRQFVKDLYTILNERMQAMKGINWEKVAEFFDTWNFETIRSILQDIYEAVDGVEGLLSSILSVLLDIWDFLDIDLRDFIDNFFTNIITAFNDNWTNFYNTFSFLSDYENVVDSFFNDDWTNLTPAFNNIVPPITLNLLSNTFTLWGNWSESLFGLNLYTIFVNIYDLWQTFISWITLLIIVYIVWLGQLLIRGDWDRLRIEITTIVKTVVWIVEAVINVIHWIFEIIWAILDVAIPFT